MMRKQLCISLGMFTGVLLIFSSLSIASEALVSTPLGKVKGVNAKEYKVFKGIPFAAPPIGENRWRAPQPVTPWDGVLDATTFSHDCMQLPFPSDAAPLGEEPAEDCLYLNVWQPKNSGSKSPVVLWLYGGGFVNGGSSPAVYDGGQFAKQGVVFVSFNYRLGRFGFFAHPALTAAKEGMLANYGFMDQIAALQWVKDNIAAFNGDPANITVMGESAGGRSVFNLLTTDYAKGLFQRAIIMSGGGRSLMAERQLNQGTEQNPSAEQVGVNFAQSKGIHGEGAAALAALRSLPAKEVVDGLNLMAIFSPPTGKPTYVGGPIIDGKLNTASTEALLKAGKAAHVPLMIGTTNQDIGFNAFKDKNSLFASLGDLATEARAAYDPSGDGSIADLGYAISQDKRMQEPARFASKVMTKAGSPVYLYRFSYVATSLQNGKLGATHASDIPFFFDTVDAKYGSSTSQSDTLMAQTILEYVVNFIKSSNPNSSNLPRWSPYDPKTNNLMNFSSNAKAVPEPDPWQKRLNVIEKLNNQNDLH